MDISKTYNNKLVEFLATQNVLFLRNTYEFDELQKVLNVFGLEIHPYMREIIKSGKPIYLEYNNNIGFTYYGSKTVPIGWYGKEPLTFEELDIQDFLKEKKKQC